jgi:hypothetical protein
MNPGLIVWMLFAHFVADFLCQTEKMALNKSKNMMALLDHSVADYVVLLSMYLLYLFFITDVSKFNSLFFINFISHFIIDGISSRIYDWTWNNDKKRLFFKVLGFDQFLHVSILLVTI